MSKVIEKYLSLSIERREARQREAARIERIFGDTAILAAIEYCDVHRIPRPEAAELSAAMKENFADVFEIALRDMRHAMHAHMGQVAEQTFTSSARLHGIGAIKRIAHSAPTKATA